MRWVTAASWWCRQQWPSSTETSRLPWQPSSRHCKHVRGERMFSQRAKNCDLFQYSDFDIDGNQHFLYSFLLKRQPHFYSCEWKTMHIMNVLLGLLTFNKMCHQRAGFFFRISSKQYLQTLCRFRKRNSMVGSLSSLISKQSSLQEGRLTHVPPTQFDWQLRSAQSVAQKIKSKSAGSDYAMIVFVEEMHAELCYAECLLQKATLTFVQVGTIDWPTVCLPLTDQHIDFLSDWLRMRLLAQWINYNLVTFVSICCSPGWEHD